MVKIKTKRVLKHVALTIAALIAITMTLAAIAVNFVLTPEKLTPIVLKQANHYLEAEVKCESVDITLFSTFPQVGIRLSQGELISHAKHDTLTATPQDSLLRFNTCLVTANPLALLASNSLKIHKILIDEATIYAYKNSEGIANWEIFSADQTTETTDSTTSQTDFNGTVEVGGIEIRKANVTFDDRSTELFADLRNFNFRLSGSLSQIKSEIALHLDAQNILFWQQGELLVNKLGFGFDTRLFADRNLQHYTLKETKLDVNGILLSAEGQLQKDSTTNDLEIDLSLGLQVPTLKTVLDLIPKSIVKESADLTAKGAVKVKGSLKGTYGSGKTPILEATALIEGASAHYKGMVHGIEQLDLNVATRINLQEKRDSYLKLHKFHFAAASSTLTCSGEVKNPLTNPFIDAAIDAKIDFTKLANTFPLEEGVVLRGAVESKLRTELLIADLKQENWGNIGLDGMVKLSELQLTSPKDSFDLRVATAGLAFGANNTDSTIVQGKTLLNAIIGFDGLELETAQQLKATINRASLSAKSSPLRDTTAIASMDVKWQCSDMNLTMHDTLQLHTRGVRAEIAVTPSKENNRLPHLSSLLVFDSIYAAAGQTIFSLQKAGFEVATTRESILSKHWDSRGKVGFAGLKLFTPAFPLPISMPASNVAFGDDAVRLTNARVKVGSSDLQVTGELSNLKEVCLHQDKLFGKMSIYSQFINCNELMKALDEASAAPPQTLERQTEEEVTPAEATSSAEYTNKLFIVPAQVDFVLDVDIRKVLFATLEIERIKGEVVMRNSAIKLDNLNLHTVGADMNTTLVYSTQDSLSAYTGFDFRMKDIQVGKLVEFIPALDTIVPMLRSLDGRVNFQIAAEAKLDAEMSLDVSSLQAATKLKGDSLVLMDGETFSEISKMLRFKNKARNVIDSVSVDLIIKDGQINIYPFLISVDRYLVAVGGRHNIDMTFDYHISLLQSPIPFSAGVDVSGDLEDFKFKITRAKYKDMKHAVRTSPVDSASTSVRFRIGEVLRVKKESLH